MSVIESAAATVEWAVSPRLVDYTAAVAAMEARVDAIVAGRAPELVWLLEHPPLYTAGTSARMSDLLAPGRFPLHSTGRGGQLTYHGPGQRVAYVMLDARRRCGDVRAFVTLLEGWIIDALARLGVSGVIREGRVGVWVVREAATPGSAREDKIAAIGIRLRRWISFHGLAINVAPDLEHFAGIVPCGISGHGVTSLADLGVGATISDVDRVLRASFEARVARVRDAMAPS